MSMDDVDDEADQLVMPKTANGKDKVLNGRVTKARASPRKAAKKDYQKMADPLGAMKDVRDENGQPMFEDKGFTSEDSDPTDVEFGQAPRPKSKHQLVKQEEDEVL